MNSQAMADDGRDGDDGSNIMRVSDAMVERQDDPTLRNRLRKVELWLLIDVPRWGIIVGLAVSVFAATILVGMFGPASVQQYLLDGTSIGEAYIELQPGMITAITIVLGINQLVLSPEFGPFSHQRQRLEDILSHRRDVEDIADINSSPTDPASFLRTITDATHEHLHELDEATTDRDGQGLSRQLKEYISEMRDGIRPVSDALDSQQFGHIGLFGAAIHYDADHHIHQLRRLRRTYEEELSDAQSQALDELLTALKKYDIAREYFRTRYLQTQFIRFSRAMLFTALPAILVAHYSVGIIGPDVLPGTTFGIRNLLWFESGTFTVTMLPILVFVSYVARIITLAETSVLIGPFSADKSLE